MTSMSFKGTTAASMGVVVLEYPPITKPKQVIETVNLPGRSGFLTLTAPIVYEPVEKKVKGYLTSAASQETVSAWLTGYGILLFGNEPTYAYTARVIEAVEFSKIVPGRPERLFEVMFKCQPYKELASPGADITLSTNPQALVSTATMDSLPLITVTGTGTVVVNVGAYTFTLTSLSGAVPVVVDCDALTVTDATYTTSYINNMTGEFPKLITGNNVVSYTGTVASIVIKPRYRWL